MRNENAKKADCEKDFEVVKRALEGDWRAHEELYVYAFGKALRAARRFNADNLLSSDEIKEVANEAFKRCILKLETYIEGNSFSAWLCGFVKNVVYEERRKKLRNFEKENKYRESELVNFVSVSPERYTVAKEQLVCARKAYDSLDALNRLLILWRVLEEISEKRVLGITKLTKAEADARAGIALKIMRKRFFEMYGFIQR